MRIRNRGVRAIVMSVVVVGTFVPESAEAQEASSIEVTERASDGESLPEPDRFELSAGLNLALGSNGAGFVGGTFQTLDVLPVVGDIGFPLGSRALITVGVRASAGFMANSYVSVSVPVTALVYLDAPRAGAFVPMVRVGLITSISEYHFAEGGLGALGPPVYVGLNVVARGGLTWFVVESVGIRAEVGVNSGLSIGSGYTALGVGLDCGASLVMRI